jgi:hypothetical protein
VPDSIKNTISGVWEQRGKTLCRYGKDQTGKITYRFNNQGFRANRDFDFIPSYAFFGCSLVFGIGVSLENTFANLFGNSHNYGLGGQYLNQDSYQHLQKFLLMPWYKDEIKIAVFWTDRDADNLDRYYQQLKQPNILHFFCGKVLPYDQCYQMMPNLDLDVSGTHIGPKTHMIMYKILCNLFNQ